MIVRGVWGLGLQVVGVDGGVVIVLLILVVVGVASRFMISGLLRMQ